jgi:hypothetical protein
MPRLQKSNIYSSVVFISASRAVSVIWYMKSFARQRGGLDLRPPAPLLSLNKTDVVI